MGKKAASGKDTAQSAGKKSAVGSGDGKRRSVSRPKTSPKPAASKTRKRSTTALAKVKKPKLTAVNPETLIMKAIQKGSIETVEKLLVMRRELKAEAAREAFFVDLAHFQAKCPVIPKNKIVREKPERGGGIRYRYASIDQIIRYVHKPLGDCGFSYTIKGVQTAKTYKAIVELHHLAGHHEVTDFEVPILPDAYMSEDQKVGSASSFSKRYAFCNATGIMTGEEDDDGQSVGTVSENGAAAERDVTERKRPEGIPEDATEQVKKVLTKMTWLPEETAKMYMDQADGFIKKGDLKSLRGLAQSLTRQMAMKKQEGEKK